MNPYDYARNLANALKESQEYKEYANIKSEVANIPEVNKMLVDFQQKQYQFQVAQMTGQKPDPAAIKEVQDLLGVLNQNPKAAAYLQAEMKFTQMVAEIYNIIGEAIKL